VRPLAHEDLAIAQGPPGRQRPRGGGSRRASPHGIAKAAGGRRRRHVVAIMK